MPEKYPVPAAIDIARGLVPDPEPTPAGLTRMAREFADFEFDVPADSDADGFLFQYGKANWFTEPTFVISLLRQLEIVDAGGDHESYAQIQFEFRYDLDADLELAGRDSQWWFPGAGATLDEWLASVAESPILSLLAAKSPREFLVWQDQV